MQGGVIYMPEVHGKGLGGTNIRETYKKEIEEGQAASEAATKVAQKMVSEKINRESKAKQQIYGETLGNMYDGDREAITRFRDHIRQEFLNGTYSSDPSMYESRIKNLNAMIENAESFYNTTYGTDAADGTGNTYRDIEIRNQRGNSVEFWEDQGLELKGDEFLDAQKRLNELQGGMYRDLQFSPDGTVLARSINAETGELGELLPFENLPQREIGSQNFLPETRVLSPASMFDLAGEQDVQLRLRQLYSGLLEDSGEVMYEGTLTKVSEMNALQKMNYMSDMYFDDNVMKGLNNTEARKFRRSLANDAALSMSQEQKEAFIAGDLEALTSTNGGEAALKEARRHWREVTRQSFVKQGASRRTSGKDKVEEPDFIRNRYVVNLATLRQEELDLAGVEGPVDIAEINGDGLEEPIEILSSTAFEAEGIPTEKANYKIYGAAFWPHTNAEGKQSSTFIARVQIPVITSEFDPETETYTEKIVYESRDVVVGHKSTGWRKEVYNNLLNNSSDLSMSMAAKYSNWADEVIDSEGVTRPQ
jgi:hypothetical protein